MSPDPYMGSYDLSNPQSMNRYSYGQNYPLGYIDRWGLDIQDDSGNSGSTSNCPAGEIPDQNGNCYSIDNSNGALAGGPQQYDYVYGDGENDYVSFVYLPDQGASFGIPEGPAPNNGTSVTKILQCASETANQFSIAGVLGLTHSTLATAFLGNTFSGITDALTHASSGQVGATATDLALGGYSQGLPVGEGVYAKGIAGVTTDAAVNAVSNPGVILSITGTATELGEEGMAGPVGWAKLGLDAATFLGSAIACASN